MGWSASRSSGVLMTANPQLPAGFLKHLLDAFPAAVFLVDEDLRILEFNAAAARRFAIDPRAILQSRLGDAQHCQHAQDSTFGCGHGSFCRHCALQVAVGAAAQGRPVVRLPHQLKLVQAGVFSGLNALLTAALLPLPHSNAVMVVIEDLDAISQQGQQLDRWSKCVLQRAVPTPTPAPSAPPPAGARLAESFAPPLTTAPASASPEPPPAKGRGRQQRDEFGYW